MQGMWRKTSMPHRNRQRKTKQTQKATAFIRSLVAATKNFSPHKEKKQKFFCSWYLLVFSATTSLQSGAIAEAKKQLPLKPLRRR
jgi:hypothetical protein